ncbi:50S ribosomal protein L19 [Candidatus Dojkabacteria bacterium]|nr:50S ribosomal protein L19 [Candidatus Dojkabacteria bacterium]
MDTNIYEKVEKEYMKKSLPNFEVGDTVKVTSAIRDDKGEKRRSQSYRGLIISQKGSGVRKTITVRKISQGVGVEKIFPVHSPNVEKVEILKKGKVKKSKIYYMRGRIGKKAMKVGESGKEVEDIIYYEEEQSDPDTEKQEKEDSQQEQPEGEDSEKKEDTKKENKGTKETEKKEGDTQEKKEDETEDKKEDKSEEEKEEKE